MAKVLGHDVKTIDKMVAHGMPYVSRPDKKQGAIAWQFDTGEVLAWSLRDSSAAQIKEAKSRLAQAKAGIKWLEYGQALGYLVEIDEVVSQIERGDGLLGAVNARDLSEKYLPAILGKMWASTNAVAVVTG